MKENQPCLINKQKEQELLFDLENTLHKLMNLYTLAWNDPASDQSIKSVKRWQTGVNNHFFQRTGWNRKMKQNACKNHKERKSLAE